MSKTNKELAVEVAIAYLEAFSNMKHANTTPRDIIPAQSVIDIIKAVHRTLESLDKA